MNVPAIVMYTTQTCADCIRTKAWLQNHRISYTEIALETTPGAVAFVEKVNNGFHSVPTLVFPDGTTLTEPTNEILEQKLRELQIIN